jgi:hypothetical protein
MEYRASIGIYQQASETESETRPITPPEVFEAAKVVANTKETKIIRNRMGVFVVTYSETGPFNEPHLSQDWLPVQVYILKQWASGGIRRHEMNDYEGIEKQFVPLSTVQDIEDIEDIVEI